MTLLNYSKGLRAALTLAVLAVLAFSPISMKAQVPESVSAQEQCFLTLKDNLAEAGIFAEPLAQLGSRSYAEVAPLFGEKKNMLSSFDVTIDQPILGIRLYSFGNQTGYTHPPKSVLPISTKSDTWGDPVKEYVLAEEYVTDPQGQEHFLNCVFLHIESDAPMSVTQDKYAYDGVAISIVKSAADESYKAWYNQAPGFDFEGNHFVTWKRLIVYPMSTQNTYFNRYDVMDAYPANKLESFEALGFFLGKEVSFKNAETGMPEAVYVSTEGGAEAELPAELLPPVNVGINFAYRLASYYQAIEAQFPEFATLLSVRGAMKYSSYKELVTKTDITEDEQQFTTLLFGDTRDLDAYYFDEDKEANPEVDKLIALLQDGDGTMAKLAAGETLAELTAPEVVAVETVPMQESPSNLKLILLMLVIVSILGIVWILYILRQKHIALNTPTI